MIDWLHTISILLLVIATLLNMKTIKALHKRIYSLEEFRNLLDEQFRNIR